MSFNNFPYYQQGSQASQWAAPYMQSPQQPTVAMLTSQQAPYQSQPFPLATPLSMTHSQTPAPQRPPPPSPALSRPSVVARPESRSTRRDEESDGETVEEQPVVSKRKKGKGKASSTEQSQAQKRQPAMPSWTRNKINGKAEEQYMLDLCCKPEFWTRWRGGDPKYNKSETIKWINRERRNFGFDFDRPQNSIDTKVGRPAISVREVTHLQVKQIEGKFQEVIRWKSETGQGLKDDDEHQGLTVRDIILRKCPRFYDLWEVLSKRMGTIPQGLWSTGDEADPTLEMMYQLVSNNGGYGGDGSDDADGETENDSDGGLSEASVVRRERLARTRSVTGGGPSATPVREQHSLDDLTGQFDSQPQGPRFPGRVTPPISTPTPSGRRVKNVVPPKEGSLKRKDVVSDILSASEKRLEFDEKRFEFEQAIRREELEEARRERELERQLRREEREREREDARLDRERERAEKAADQAAWDDNWRREREGGVELMAFVAAFGNRP